MKTFGYILNFKTMAECKYIFISSDHHIDDKDHDEDLFHKEFERAKKLDARFILNGDLFSAILVKDVKRYSKGRDKSEGDDMLGSAIDLAVNKLLPYASNIDMLGFGNHESTILKYHNFNLIKAVTQRIFDKTGIDIPRGHYRNFIRYKLDYLGSRGVYTIHTDHGKGGSAPVTEGTIYYKRISHIGANLLTAGHNHSRHSGVLNPIIYIDQNNNIKTIYRQWLNTGCYVKGVSTYDGDYQVDYGEERMLNIQKGGGALIKLFVNKNRRFENEIIM